MSSDCAHYERPMTKHKHAHHTHTRARRAARRRADDTIGQVARRAVLRSAARNAARVTAWRVELRLKCKPEQRAFDACVTTTIVRIILAINGEFAFLLRY